jgi:hypothetical protein
MLSKMMFAAVQLIPSESVYCSSIPGFVPECEAGSNGSRAGNTKRWWKGGKGGSTATQKPLLLWGLTLGVISDFLEHIPPHKALELWTYPTFTNWDVRFTLWAMSYSFRKQKQIEMMQTPNDATAAVDEGIDAAEIPKQYLPENGTAKEMQPGEVGIGGLGVGRHWGRSKRDALGSRGSAVNSMLEGYYPIVRKAVTVALVGRVSIATALVAFLWTKYVRKRY